MSGNRKRIITNLLSAFFVFTGIAAVWRIFFKRFYEGRVTILVYHRIFDLDNEYFPYYEKNVSATPALFEKQVAYLKKKFNIISLGQYVRACQNNLPLPHAGVIITFDDNYEDVYTNAYPILKKYDIPATLFVTTDYILSGKLYWWDDISENIHKTAVKNVEINGIGSYELDTGKLKKKAIEEIVEKLTHMDAERRTQVVNELNHKLEVKNQDAEISKLYLTWEHINEMRKNNMEIGAHTLSHPNLKQLDDTQLSNELVESKQKIENEIKSEVNLFAYTYGHEEHFDKRIRSAVKNAGFICGCTTVYGSTNEKNDLYQLKRIPIFHYNNMNVFKAKLSGIFDNFEKLEHRLFKKTAV
jgi:peptidoglycan/xylan/chitin deacetylase (PgdA/CDA1 family)